jgi:hypothetical protein
MRSAETTNTRLRGASAQRVEQTRGDRSQGAAVNGGERTQTRGVALPGGFPYSSQARAGRDGADGQRGA